MAVTSRHHHKTAAIQRGQPLQTTLASAPSPSTVHPGCIGIADALIITVSSAYVDSSIDSRSGWKPVLSGMSSHEKCVQPGSSPECSTNLKAAASSTCTAALHAILGQKLRKCPEKLPSKLVFSHTP
ncbi:uncharacterized protein LOC113566808 [Drosophila persimilis]|uniref:uncharacterized protein LOC113566808 n=1 Tax=Drosophila persimilis TaxID=7234 RepID=UPI000F07A856|nr:uncharacterized protein LOC113566808 [Drosophila persimilis]